MKKWIQLIAICTTLTSSMAQAASLKNVWTSPALLKQPESVVYDSKNKRFFVSNIDGQPLDKDGHGFISILNEDGNVQKLDWVNGLNAPKGLCLTPSHLYVTDIDQFVT
ncbi:MAG: ATP/GTP-binding protein, partial [Deltaproteobacteria bacterium]|nr:ATP/GTP-binding protein [Deltaproteobacteria bacterium]